MSCTYDYQDDVAMAENGWTQDEINQLRKEVQLAEAEANQASYEAGLTREQQQFMEAKAREKALQVGHDRFHRKLADMMKSLDHAAANRRPEGAAVGHSHKPISAADKATLKKLFES